MENEPALQALGYLVLTAPSAEATLEVLDGAVPDLILTDEPL